MRARIQTLLLGVALAMPLFGWAQAATEHDHNHGSAPAATQTPLTDGEVKKVDPEVGKVTIKHGEIRQLDMPPMTMVFTVKDKSLLTNIKPGDKVQFTVVSEGGKLLLTSIQPQP